MTHQPLPFVLQGREHLSRPRMQRFVLGLVLPRLIHRRQRIGEVCFREFVGWTTRLGCPHRPVGDVEGADTLDPGGFPGLELLMGVAGPDEVAPDVGPTPERVHPFDLGDGLVDGEEVRADEQLAVRLQRASSAPSSASIPRCSVSTSADRNFTTLNTVVSAPTKTHSHHRLFFLSATSVASETSRPWWLSAAPMRCKGRPSTYFSTSSRARNWDVNRPLGIGLGTTGATRMPRPLHLQFLR